MPDLAEREVEAAIERFFHWAAFADKSGGSVQETTLRGLVAAQFTNPVGVIGIACPDEAIRCWHSLSLARAGDLARQYCRLSCRRRSIRLSATDLYQVLRYLRFAGGRGQHRHWRSRPL